MVWYARVCLLVYTGHTYFRGTAVKITLKKKIPLKYCVIVRGELLVVYI